MFKVREGKCFLGKTLVLETSKIEMEITVEVGPRIISLKKKGQENIMFQDINDSVNKDVSSIYGENEMWHIYGGHRIWISPEDLETYYPDNEIVNYKVTEDSVTFCSSKSKGNIDSVLEIKYLTETQADIIMMVKNVGKEPKKFSIWALTVLKCGGKLIVPMETKDTGLLANRNFVFWPYSQYNDPRYKLNDKELTVLSNPNVKNPFKLGFYKENPKTIYEINQTVFTKDVKTECGEYPDYCCNVETYTSNLIHEVETLAPVKTVKVGETVCHIERWTID